jgi:hypothetical protein
MEGPVLTPEGIPQPLDADDDDVAWALQTAAVQWKRGAFADAIVWLRRAAESAVQVDQFERAQVINVAANRLSDKLLASAGVSSTSIGTVDLASSAPLVDEIIDDYDDDDDGAESIEVESAGPHIEVVVSSAPPPLGSELRHQPPPRDLLAGLSRPGDRDAPAELAGERISGVPRESQGAAAARARPPLPPPPRRPPAPSAPLSPPRSSAAADRLTPTPADALVSDTDADALASAAAAVLIEAEAVAAEAEREAAERLAMGALEAPSSTGVEPPSEPEPPRPLVLVSEPPLAAPEPLLAPVEPAEPEPPAASRASEPPVSSKREPHVLGVALASVRGLEDLPEEAQAQLVSQARLEALGPTEELALSAVALVVKGSVELVPAVSDLPCAHARKGDVIFTRGTLTKGIALGVVAGEEGAVVATWDSQALDGATADCPWVADELRGVADHFQALAGATMGILGERLDDALRQTVFGKCETRQLLEGDVLIEAGQSLAGLHIVGAGRLEVFGPEGDKRGELGAGDFVFASAVLGGGKAPARAVAGAGGALVLHASRHATHELLVSVPPLLEILTMM